MKTLSTFLETGLLEYTNTEMVQGMPHWKLDDDRYVRIYLHWTCENKYISSLILRLESKTKGKLCDHTIKFPWGSYGSFTGGNNYRWQQHIQPTNSDYVDFCTNEVNEFINRYWR